MKAIDLTNQTFGRLTALYRVSSVQSGNAKRAVWHCKCLCGNFIDVWTHNLRIGSTRSCGCYQKEFHRKYLDQVDSLTHQHYALYQNRARKRKITFTLSFNDFYAWIMQQCYYCNQQHNYRFNNQDNLQLCGIDRLDSNLGYTLNNCVPCCKYCNIAKNTQTPQEYIDHCRNVVKHWGE